MQKILDILNKHVLFKYMDPSQLDMLAGAMEMKNFAADEVILQEGDPNGDYYVIESGNVAAIKGETTVFTYEGTGAFGELAIMYNAPRAATSQAVTAVECWALEQRRSRPLSWRPPFRSARSTKPSSSRLSSSPSSPSPR